MEDHNIYAPPKAELESVSSEEFQLAGRWARLGGAMIDSATILMVTFPIMYYSGFWEKAATQTLAPTDSIILGIMGFLFFLVFHGYLLAKHGQTIGKKIVGTRIVSNETKQILPLWKVVFLFDISSSELQGNSQ